MMQTYHAVLLTQRILCELVTELGEQFQNLKHIPWNFVNILKIFTDHFKVSEEKKENIVMKYFCFSSWLFWETRSSRELQPDRVKPLE